MNFFAKKTISLLILSIFLLKEIYNKTNDNKMIVRLENYQHTQYYGPLFIGSTKQAMNFIFSTGSNNISLFSSDCKNCDSKNAYKHEISNTFMNYTQSHFLEYSMGNVSGVIATDTFSFSEDDSLPMQVLNANFLLVNHQNGFENFKADGVIGLNLHNTPNEKNLIYQLYEQGQISSPRFSLFLSSSNTESRLYIGDYSQNTAISNFYRQMSFCQVGKKSKNWSCSINEVEIEKKKFVIDSRVTLDSGINYLIIPISDYKIIKKQIFEETDSDCKFNENHQLLCRCSSPDIFPSLKLKIEGNYFEIKLSKLIDFFPKFTYSCRFEIFVDMNNFDNWILGTNVMKDTLFSFDVASRRIGFYQNPDLKSFINKENLVVYNDDEGNPKIGYIFAIAFILLCLYALVKCSSNDKFMSGLPKNDSFELGHSENKIHALKKNFEDYNYKNFEESNHNNFKISAENQKIKFLKKNVDSSVSNKNDYLNENVEINTHKEHLNLIDDADIKKI